MHGTSPTITHPWLRFLLPLLALTVLICAMGILAHGYLRANIRSETERTLAVIAEQKRQQLETWLAQARSDADLYFSGTSQFGKLFDEWLNGGRQDQQLLGRMRERLANLAQARGWGSALVFDAAGQPVLAVGATAPQEHVDQAEALLRDPALRVAGLHQDAAGQSVYRVLAPIGTPGSPPLGVVLLTWGAEQALFPLVTSWPVPTRSAETYLIRRDADQVRYLTPLRFQNAGQQDLTRPLATADLAAAQAAQGQQGLIKDGVDYRGVAVLAYATPIQGTPWVMVAEIDRAEADAGIERIVWATALGVGLGLLLVYTAAFLLWDRSRQQQELAGLRAREAADTRFRLLFEQHLAVMLIIDPASGLILDANQAAADFYGHARDQLQGMPIARLNCLPPATLEAEWLGAEPRTRSLFVFPQQLADGSIRTAEVHSAPVILDDRPVLFAIIHDITERREIEERLRLSEQRHRLLADHSLDVIWTMDLGGHVTYASPSVVKLRGYTPEEVLQQRLEDILVPESCAFVREALTEAVARIRQGHAVEPFRAELTERRKDGSTVCVEVTATIMYDRSGRFVEVLGVSRDLTERKRAEAALLEASHFLRTLIDAIPNPIFFKDREGRYQGVNRAFEEATGLRREDLIGLTVHEFCAPELAARYQEMDDQLFLSEGTQVYESQVRYADGKIHDVVFSKAVYRDTSGALAGLVGISLDITERKWHEAELQQARDDAETANAAKSAFLAQMSHEIRTPMNVVLGLAQVLERSGLAPDQHDMVVQISTAGRSLLAILNEILDLAKIEAGRLELQSRPFALQPLLAEVDSLLGSTARAKGLGFTIEPPAGLEDGLLGDPLRLQQVLVNLVGNAVKFTARGDVHIRITALDPSPAQVRLRFAVSDSGIGISPDAITDLFAPFTQADGSITRRFGGTGLGLAICKRLVEQMGGAIGAESREGLGSTFWFELPFPRTPRPLESAPLPAPQPGGSRLAGMQVLVTDDSPMNREVAARMLALEGARATLAGNGRQALDLLRARPRDFDAVLMDVQMPELDGLSATRLIRSEPDLTTLPVVGLTAGVLPAQLAAARDAGMNEVLTKPLDAERLAAVLSRWAPPAVRAETTDPAPADPAAPDADGAFPALPGIDPLQAARTLGGNRALFLDLLERFAEESPDLVSGARAALDAGDTPTAARCMHTLKGNAGYIGALKLRAEAQRLELAIKAGETGLEQPLADLHRATEALIAAAARWRKRQAPAPAPAPARPLDAAALTALGNALRTNDLDAWRQLDALQPALAGHLGEQRAEALGQAIRGLRFPEALTLLNGLNDGPQGAAPPGEVAWPVTEP